MVSASVGLAVFPHAIARVFTPDAGVIAATVPLFGVAAVFQLFDGVQVTAMGALRGAGDTHSGLIDTPLFVLAIRAAAGDLARRSTRGWGAKGLWVGLCCALVVAGCVLLWRWGRVSSRVSREL